MGRGENPFKKIENINFKVALSFPGEKREFVSQVAVSLSNELGEDTVFYDMKYQAQLARPNLDNLLQDIYRNRSDLIVVFLCEEYAEKEWCGLEWRAIRDLIKIKEDNKIMFIRFSDAHIDGVFSIDGYINANKHSPIEISNQILQRVKLLES